MIITAAITGLFWSTGQAWSEQLIILLMNMENRPLITKGKLNSTINRQPTKARWALHITDNGLYRGQKICPLSNLTVCVIDDGKIHCWQREKSISGGCRWSPKNVDVLSLFCKQAERKTLKTLNPFQIPRLQCYWLWMSEQLLNYSFSSHFLVAESLFIGFLQPARG